MTITLIVDILKGIIKSAPDIFNAFMFAKQFIAGLFGAKVITAEEQAKLFAYIEAVALNVKNNTPPPQWTVEPDPE